MENKITGAIFCLTAGIMTGIYKLIHFLIYSSGYNEVSSFATYDILQIYALISLIIGIAFICYGFYVEFKQKKKK